MRTLIQVRSFHSKLVRLKVGYDAHTQFGGAFSFQTGSIKRGMAVGSRLSAKTSCRCHTGLSKNLIGIADKVILDVFRFQTGSIKSRSLKLSLLRHKRFHSKVVRLQEMP